MAEFTLYKVLRPSQYPKGKLTGGHTSFDWTPYLPKVDSRGILTGPGKTLSVRGKLEMCVNGLHVTHIPAQWGGTHKKARVFEVRIGKEVKGKLGGKNSGQNKICVRSVRLLREVVGAEKAYITSQFFPGWKKSKKG